ncbi:hypothetical protein QJQ45_023245 [Haematococcus lacustris]|nr:hypothetical protein QJQ45_023245 [Haematococcus lacustris]
MAVACEEAASLAAARCLARAVGWQAGDEASGGGAARAAAGGAAGAGRPAAPGSSRCSPTVGFCLLQRGVLRTNCIDCLDRTNVAQYACGLAGFGRQLFLLGLSDIPHVDDDSSIARVLSSQYEFMGDSLAMQYGGSDAHSVFFQRQKGGWEASTLGKNVAQPVVVVMVVVVKVKVKAVVKDVITSIRRFYSNSITDAEKQDAINLFLGNYVPSTPGQPELWELENDVYLHATDPSTGRRKRDSLLAGSWPSGPPHSLSVRREELEEGEEGEGERRLAAWGVPPPLTRDDPIDSLRLPLTLTPAPAAASPAPYCAQPPADRPSLASLASLSSGDEADPPTTSGGVPLDSLDVPPPPSASAPSASNLLSMLGEGGLRGSRPGPGGAQPPPPQPTPLHDAAVSLLGLSLLPGGPPTRSAAMPPSSSGSAQPSPPPPASLFTLSEDEDIETVLVGAVRDSHASRSPRTLSRRESELEIGVSRRVTHAVQPQAYGGSRPAFSFTGLFSAPRPAPAAGAWTFTSLFNSFIWAPPSRLTAVPVPKDLRPSLTSFDALLAQPCRRSVAVRLYSTTQSGSANTSMMWQAVQQAFSFFPFNTTQLTSGTAALNASHSTLATLTPPGPSTLTPASSLLPDRATHPHPTDFPSPSQFAAEAGGVYLPPQPQPSGSGWLSGFGGRQGGSQAGGPGVLPATVSALHRLGWRTRHANNAANKPRSSVVRGRGAWGGQGGGRGG